MRIAIGSDHAGYELKQRLYERLTKQGHLVRDFGAPLAEAVVAGEHQLGIVVCSNGVGVNIAANKVRGARAALCTDTWSAKRARQHTDCNILALGSFVTGPALAEDIVDIFIESEFEGGRHVRRLAKLAAVEAANTTAPTERIEQAARRTTAAQLSPMA